MTITIRDVSKESGYSTATVSRALNGYRNVSSPARDAIRAAVQRLGYEGTSITKAVRQVRTRTVGLLVPRVETFNDTSAVQLIHDALAAEGYSLLLSCHGDNADTEAAALRTFADRSVEAIVHIPFAPDGAESVLGSVHVPIVEFERRSTSARVDAVVASLQDGAFQMTDYLIGLGHRRISMFIGNPTRKTNVERVRGFWRAINEARLDARQCQVMAGESSGSWGAAATLGLDVAAGPTALIGGSTQISLGILKGLAMRHLRIPTDISLVAFSNSEWCEVLNPPLTAYEVPVAEMGLIAAQMLLNRLAPLSPGYELAPSEVKFTGRLVIRGSAIPPRSIGSEPQCSARTG